LTSSTFPTRHAGSIGAL